MNYVNRQQFIPYIKTYWLLYMLIDLFVFRLYYSIKEEWENSIVWHTSYIYKETDFVLIDFVMFTNFDIFPRSIVR